MSDHDLGGYFKVFLINRIKLPMGPKATGEEWIKMRKETYDVYRQKFSPSQIGNLLESDFHHFLTSKGNMSWTNLQRGCKKATDQMGITKLGTLILKVHNI